MFDPVYWIFTMCPMYDIIHEFTVVNVAVHVHFTYVAVGRRKNGWQTLLINVWNSSLLNDYFMKILEAQFKN